MYRTIICHVHHFVRPVLKIRWTTGTVALPPSSSIYRPDNSRHRLFRTIYIVPVRVIYYSWINRALYTRPRDVTIISRDDNNDNSVHAYTLAATSVRRNQRVRGAASAKRGKETAARFLCTHRRRRNIIRGPWFLLFDGTSPTHTRTHRVTQHPSVHGSSPSFRRDLSRPGIYDTYANAFSFFFFFFNWSSPHPTHGERSPSYYYFPVHGATTMRAYFFFFYIFSFGIVFFFFYYYFSGFAPRIILCTYRLYTSSAEASRVNIIFHTRMLHCYHPKANLFSIFSFFFYFSYA